MNRIYLIGAIVTVLLVATVPLIIQDSYTLGFVVLAGVFSLVTVGMDMLVGYAGQISLGQGGFFAIGAYVSAILTSRYGIPPLPAMIAAVLITALVAFVLGVPMLKALTHFHLAMATLIFAMLIYSILLIGGDFTGGFTGIQGIPPFSVGPIAIIGDVANYYLIWGIVFLGVLFAFNVANSQSGRILRAIEGDELGAQSLGVDVAQLKVKIFVLSAVYAAIAGSLIAHYTASVTPSQYDIVTSLDFLTMAFLGGKGTVIGGVVGASFLKLLPQFTEFLKDYRLLSNGVILTIVLLFAPQGVAGVVRDLVRMLQRRSGAKVTPSEEARTAANTAASGTAGGEL